MKNESKEKEEAVIVTKQSGKPETDKKTDENKTEEKKDKSEKNPEFPWKKKIQYTHGVTVDTNKIIKDVRDRVKNENLTETQIAIIVQTTIATIRDHLLSYNDIDLDGVGRFYWKTWQNKKGENRYDFYLDQKFHLIDLYEE
jgi:nucleoid DNA-binding protein